MGEKKKQGRGEPKSSPRRLRTHERRMRAIQMRIAGLTWKEIALQLGITEAGAYKLVMDHVKKEGREKAEEFIGTTLERLERMITYLWPKVQNGEERAVDRVLSIVEREMRLLGLDKIRTEISGPEGKPVEFNLKNLEDDELRTLLELVRKAQNGDKVADDSTN